MTNEITLKTRLLNLYEDSTTSNPRFNSDSADEKIKLKKGEILFHEEMVATDNGKVPVVLMKVGNGATTNDKLNVVAARAADVYAWAKETGLTITKDGEGNVVSGIVWDASLNEGKGGIKFTTAAVATSEGLEDLQTRVKDIEDDYVTEAELTAAIEDAKKYANDNDANTTYGFSIPAEGDNKGKLVITPSEGKATVLDLITPKELEDILANYATKTYVDNAIAAAKKYADDNDKDTTYGLTYENKTIKLVAGGSNMEIDATPFIKDGMISDVEYDEATNSLTITFNTDAGKEEIVVPLVDLVDIYTGVAGDRVNVSVSSDNKISADIVNGSIGTTQLDATVKASLAKADSALQAHQDISNLATKAEVENALKAAKKYADDNDQDTTYTAGEGIAIGADNKISNTGVRTVATGEKNGTISVNTNGTTAEVSVAGLKSAAYTESSAYDAAGSAAAAKSGAEATAASALASAKSELEGKISSGDTATLNAAKADATEKANTAKADAISEIKNFYTGGTGIVIGADGSISISESLTLILDANKA